ncbi:MAG: hypothetical protein KGL10_06875 [Alphaproteobacteria bacterium]|nr:hypothetical protein [Alphaproteobacteria bacterium]MDE2337017.1 hypothetical protein [Alphaproteobacteria bacterium]
MFNNKRKAEKKQQQQRQRQEARKRTEGGFEDDIAAACEIKDPAARLLKLTDIEHAMTQYLSGARRETIYRGTTISNLGNVTGIGMMFGGLLVGHVLLPVGIGLVLAAFPAVTAADKGEDARNRRVSRELAAEARGHFLKMERLAMEVEARKAALLAYHAEDMINSPHYEKVLRLPGLSEQFAGVAAKQVAALKEELAAAKKAAEQGTSAPSAVRDYEKFKTLLNPKK